MAIGRRLLVLLLHIVTLSVAAIVSLTLKPFIVTEDDVLLAGLFGNMFLKLLQGLMIPVIVMNVLNALAYMGCVTCPSILLKAVVYFFFTSLLSVNIGIILCLVIPLDGASGEDIVSHPVDILYSMTMNIFPSRLSGIFIGPVKYDLIENSTSSMMIVTRNHNCNILGLIACCLAYGVVMRKNDHRVAGQHPSESYPYLWSFSRKTQTIMLYTQMFVMPAAVVSFTIKMIADTYDWSLMFNLMKFIGIIICGLVAHAVFLLPLLYFITVRKNPFRLIQLFYCHIVDSTPQCKTSTTTLKLCLRLCREAGIDQDISQLLLPLGHKLNLNGTSLYEATAVVFVARLQNVTLHPAQLAVLGLMVAMVSIGVGGLHGRGAIVTVFVMKAFGLQHDNLIGLLAFVEILLYPLCEAVNAAGNCFGAAIINDGRDPE